MAEEDVYTKDGTVDYLGNPANRKETGTWRACPFIIVSFTESKLLIISTVHALNFNLLIIVQSQLLLMKRLKLKRAFH
ncbi:hypothetical protein D5086_017816 [Populus alba]|uniref:Uncharacterized protein n=1 Tax=Populus alba TaxID=43335 RepID=A0ACC4BPJ5_POPAL